MRFAYDKVVISVPVLKASLGLGPFVLDREPKPRVYKFYWADENIACAHSESAGAETLLKRLSD